MQESARPRGAVSREGPSIPVLAAMSPELKIVHETHKGGVTAALFAKFLWLFPILHRVCKEAPVVLVWTMLSSTRHRGRRDGCAQEDWRGASPPLHCPLLPTTQSHRALCARGKSHVLMSLSVLLRDAGHRGCHRGGFQKGGEGACRGLLQTPGGTATGCVAGIPRLQRCHLDLRRWEVERRARDRGTNPLQSMKHNRVRRGGLLTPGVCKSELPFVQA